MTKLNKLKVSLLALAIVATSTVVSVAQSTSTTAPGTSIQSAHQKYPASAELKNFKEDPSNPELSNLRRSLLENRVQLESGQANQSLSQEQITLLNQRISTLESKIAAMNSSDPKTTQLAQREQMKKDAVQSTKQASQKQVMVSIIEQKKCTRSEFLSLTESQQREMLVSVRDLNITDLVNGTAASMKLQSENVYVITEDNFRNTDIMKQIYVLNNPSSYIIVPNGTPRPKHQISKAEFNSFPADRQKAIIDSNQYEITN